MKVIGITGGIGSGKSTVIKILLKLGCKIIDADNLAKEILMKGSLAYDKVVTEFGEKILDSNNEINRKILAKIVFENKESLLKLESITHKDILLNISKKVAKLKMDKGKTKVIAIEASIPVKEGFINICDEIWVITANINIRIQRMIKRDNLKVEDIMKRINAQLKEREYRKIGNVLIKNNKGIDLLEKKVFKNYNRIISKF